MAKRSRSRQTRRRFLRTGGVTAGALLAPVGARTGGAEPNSTPGEDGYEEADPGSVDLDPEGVREAIEYAESQNALSVRVYRRGYLVGTSQRDAATESVPNNVWSTSKGMTSLLVGRAQTLGYLDVADPIGEYLPEYPGVTDEHYDLTIRHLLTQASGLHFDWGEGVEAPPDTVRYTLGLPFDHEPGTHFEYAQYPCTLLTAVVEEAVGRDVQAFAQTDLFGPMGIDRRDWFWRRDRSGHTHGWAHLHISPKALARVGHLMLHQGQWGTDRILSRRYVREAHEPTETNPGYGYLLWTNAGDRLITPIDPGREVIEGPKPMIRSAPRDLYAFRGLGGQNIYIVPSLDVVIVRTGFFGQEEWEHEFFRILMRAVRDADVEDPGPYEGVDSAPVDIGYWVDPTSMLGWTGVGPRGPDGCNALGCDGEIAYEGTLESGHDAAATAGWKLTGG